jgi:hypothetical protein
MLSLFREYKKKTTNEEFNKTALADASSCSVDFILKNFTDEICRASRLCFQERDKKPETSFMSVSYATQ